MLAKFRQTVENLLSVEDERSDSDFEQLTSFAAAALLLEAAQTDNQFDASELAQIEVALVTHLGVDPGSIKQVLQSAQQHLDHATCLHEITSIINQNWAISQKINLVESMWRVVLSDQNLDPHEQHLMRKIKGLLHIPQSEYIAAKLRARDALGVDSE